MFRPIYGKYSTITRLLLGRGRKGERGRVHSRSEFSRHVTVENARKSSEGRRKGSSNSWAKPVSKPVTQFPILQRALLTCWFQGPSQDIQCYLLDTQRPGVDGIEIEEEGDSQDEF